MTTSNNAFGPIADQPDSFNAIWYAWANPDVVAAHMDPLAHYQQYGKSEGRQPYDGGPGTPLTAKKRMVSTAIAMPDDAGCGVLIFADAKGRVGMSGIGKGWATPIGLFGIGLKWISGQIGQPAGAPALTPQLPATPITEPAS